jgi:hypothetical protein
VWTDSSASIKEYHVIVVANRLEKVSKASDSRLMFQEFLHARIWFVGVDDGIWIGIPSVHAENPA